MVLVLSGHSNVSEQIEREVDRAAQETKTDRAVRIEDVTLSPNLEYYLSTKHWLDALTPPRDAAMVALADAVERVLAKLGPRAAELPDPRQTTLADRSIPVGFPSPDTDASPTVGFPPPSASGTPRATTPGPAGGPASGDRDDNGNGSGNGNAPPKRESSNGKPAVPSQRRTETPRGRDSGETGGAETAQARMPDRPRPLRSRRTIDGPPGQAI